MILVHFKRGENAKHCSETREARRLKWIASVVVTVLCSNFAVPFQREKLSLTIFNFQSLVVSGGLQKARMMG